MYVYIYMYIHVYTYMFLKQLVLKQSVIVRFSFTFVVNLYSMSVTPLQVLAAPLQGIL